MDNKKEFPTTKKDILANAENPEWLEWKQIQEKYPKKWVMLGYKDKGSMDSTVAHVLGIAETFDEINAFHSKYSDIFNSMKIYIAGFSTRITTLTKRKKRMIISLKAVVIE
ncbi:MAG: hypothetical protein EAZ44_04120 [Cytophagia bacterium]|nr:MAG: hypothetical protein EAZ44_04120 [Cytophagia bacterium]TAG42620.1 MAG: hypothetical protein EAZ31_05740 [Cytophagia bacterium]